MEKREQTYEQLLADAKSLSYKYKLESCGDYGYQLAKLVVNDPKTSMELDVIARKIIYIMEGESDGEA